MLSIYANKLRPQRELDAINEATRHCPEKTLKKWQKITTHDCDHVYFILNGVVEVRRNSDELCMFTSRSQSIFGLAGLFYDTSHIYGIARTDTQVRIIPKEDFLRIINEQSLWPEITKIFSWYICMLNKRDDILIARSAYSVVLEFLLEINELIVHQNRDINVYDYIQEYTNLARSTIIKILSDLKKGKYIVVEKGRLINISALPERY
ncbi:helix-turn-helix domain-containing protein [Enterobacteriaceae bacterium H4N4]|uniref:Helix-turn-helix domain-containing protein n=1 Tax=Silvania confinis TaxID=2926470 RepID=A0A9J6QNJ5_9ENTR|nr:helix-turn-helix domain-containing protein [Silvania confinis]MCU6670854.1 helix-turn-helix domain-containing protein [Silvania confinis]